MNILSLGAGVQSSTMALMAAHGEITPMPDCAIMADTKAEGLDTYKYLIGLMPALPFQVHIVSKGDLYKDLMASGPGIRVSNPPAYTETGMLTRGCTVDYKIAAIKRKAKSLSPTCTMWIGISTDEAIRMKPSQVQYITHRWPLIEAGMTRWDCEQWLRRNGYNIPPKSACTFCPYHDDATWRDMKINKPYDFAQAVEVDNHIREGLGNTVQKLFLHKSRKPLQDVDFSNAEDMGQQTMFGDECEGMCGV